MRAITSLGLGAPLLAMVFAVTPLPSGLQLAACPDLLASAVFQPVYTSCSVRAREYSGFQPVTRRNLRLLPYTRGASPARNRLCCTSTRKGRRQSFLSWLTICATETARPEAIL